MHGRSRVVDAGALCILAGSQATREKLRLYPAALDGLSNRGFDKASQRFSFLKHAFGCFTEFGVDAEGGKSCSFHGIALQMRCKWVYTLSLASKA